MATVTAKRVPAKSPQPTSANRTNAVFIRKSGKDQEDAAQIANVKTMLATKGIVVADDHWFVCQVGRRWVTKNEVFKRLIGLVESNAIDTVYIEDQTRWGTRSSPEMFRYIEKFRRHKSHLYDLRFDRDLAAKDVYSEIMTVLKSHDSQEELKKLAFRPLRSKVNNFKERGSWPTGTHPFGFGKRCFAADGKTVLWEWQPINRKLGQHFYVDAKGKLRPGAAGIKIPRKDRGTIIKLVANSNKNYVKSIQLIFELFVSEGLSYRAIAIRLNDAARKFYNKPFNHALVRELLHNPAYVGDTHYGKVMSGELCSFDRNGEMVEMLDTETDEVLPIVRRSADDRIIKQNTHKGLIDRKTWNAAQARIKDAESRPITSPRSADYYLKPILVCGHCGKNMTGGREGKGDKEIIAYMCSTYRSGKSNAQKVSCGAHRITHIEAEKLLLEKLKELKFDYEQLRSDGARDNIQESIGQLNEAKDEVIERRWALIREGGEALEAFYAAHLDGSSQSMVALRSEVRRFYIYTEKVKDRPKRLRDLVQKIEAEAAKIATNELALALAKLESNMDRREEQGVGVAEMESIKSRIAKLENEITDLKERTSPISERLASLYASWDDLIERMDTLIKELPGLQNREKGEALRKVFQSVTLFWKATFHPNEENPGRDRKTERKGRYSYELLLDKIVWNTERLNPNGCS